MISSSSMSLKWCTSSSSASIVFLQTRLWKRAPNHNRNFQKKRGRSSSLFSSASSLSASRIISSLLYPNVRMRTKDSRIKSTNQNPTSIDLRRVLTFGYEFRFFSQDNKMITEPLYLYFTKVFYYLFSSIVGRIRCLFLMSSRTPGDPWYIVL